MSCRIVPCGLPPRTSQVAAADVAAVHAGEESAEEVESEGKSSGTRLHALAELHWLMDLAFESHWPRPETRLARTMSWGLCVKAQQPSPSQGWEASARARWPAHWPQMRRPFRDGVYWVIQGKKPKLAEKQHWLARAN
jgi:hypothetical protein